MCCEQNYQPTWKGCSFHPFQLWYWGGKPSRFCVTWTGGEKTEGGCCFRHYSACPKHHQDNQRSHMGWQTEFIGAGCNYTCKSQDCGCWVSLRPGYNASWDVMISLGLPKDDQSFPSLSLSDTFCQPTHLKRKIGDSCLSDGHIWTTGVNGGQRDTAPSLHGSDSQTGESSTDELAVGTQGSSRKSLYPYWKIADLLLMPWSKEKKCKEGHSLKGAKRQIRKMSPNQAPTNTISNALAVRKAAPSESFLIKERESFEIPLTSSPEWGMDLVTFNHGKAVWEGSERLGRRRWAPAIISVPS